MFPMAGLGQVPCECGDLQPCVLGRKWHRHERPETVHELHSMLSRQGPANGSERVNHTEVVGFPNLDGKVSDHYRIRLGDTRKKPALWPVGLSHRTVTHPNDAGRLG